jgi:hypothetical protein
MAEQENFTSKQSREPLSSGQKITAGVLVFAAIFTIIFGVLQLKKSVNEPFERQANSGNKNQNANTASDDIVALQNKDSDEDGLSDYEEIYIYSTSPYIQDSDSDGLDDKKEIDSGGDPNCPVGKTCGIINPNSIDTENQQPESNNVENVEDIVTDPFGLGNLGGMSDLQDLLGGVPAETEDISSLLPDELPPAQIRELLKQYGMPENVLDQFTDEQLIKAYQETLKKIK